MKLAFRLDGHPFTEPCPFTQSLGEAVVVRGATLRTGLEVTDISSIRRPLISLSNGELLIADVAVIAAGAWLSRLAEKLGVRTLVQAGRGYSFSVSTEQPTEHSNFPHQRLACTPYQGRVRIGGTMDFLGPDEPFRPRRVQGIVSAARGLFTGMDLDDRQDDWGESARSRPTASP
ncbi:NAD(P)/FAD-dependent oxidoreductase [Brachybacterium vulturis]|uniref:NAD(P)/FAD-dependent oxidoreductase n=1 Tax=Brachybacterium vulturis TaxID=2017484 RepID=UPI0012FD3C32|nr:FAD-dependent oxidoreductase [Brachybacterium vulturis]